MYESGRTPVADLGAVSVAAGWVGFAALVGAEFPASCAGAKPVKAPSSSTHFSNRIAPFLNLLLCKSIQVTYLRSGGFTPTCPHSPADRKSLRASEEYRHPLAYTTAPDS